MGSSSLCPAGDLQSKSAEKGPAFAAQQNMQPTVAARNLNEVVAGQVLELGLLKEL